MPACRPCRVATDKNVRPASPFHPPKLRHNAPLPCPGGSRRRRRRAAALSARRGDTRMGPTNVALLKLHEADKQLRDAQARLDAAARNVRIQERRVADLSEKLKVAQTSLRAQQARAGHLDLDLRSRDAHIEKLRTQQQTARNNKEYQAFLVEINTGKVDRGKVEEEAVKVMEAVEKAKAEATALAAHVESERAKLATMREQISETLAALQREVDALPPAREA